MKALKSDLKYAGVKAADCGLLRMVNRFFYSIVKVTLYSLQLYYSLVAKHVIHSSVTNRSFTSLNPSLLLYIS